MGETTGKDRERNHRYYLANREKIKERNRRYAQSHPESSRERSWRYRAAHPEAIREQSAQYRASNREAVNESSARYRASNREKIKESSRRYRTSLRTAVFDHYGWTCACCGSKRQPTIDHVNGNGGQHREELFGEGRGARADRFYVWLRANGFPGGFQTLCLPCNSSKAGRPHCRLNHQKVTP